ncbi:14052_t:CDS:2 [Dentiscutata erythropus]|uniref:14052_t:CDS:1 n=1 Tax=Dentiscutata erythropus TaxID=1348616 RepID=A0A9N9D955_9GLOM|nr:14052_t:CDS:2 [Dentiscutata erythropus]
MEGQPDNKVETIVIEEEEIDSEDETKDENYINPYINVSKILFAIAEKFREINSQYSNISKTTLVELQNLDSKHTTVSEITSTVIKIILENSSELSSADISQIIEELCKLKEFRYEFMSAIVKESPKIVNNPSVLYYLMSEIVEDLPGLASHHPDLLSEFLKKCTYLKLPPELEKALKEKKTFKNSKKTETFECIMKFGTVKILDTSIRPSKNIFDRIFGKSKRRPKNKILYAIACIFERLATLRSVEICQSPVFEAIIIQRKSYLIDGLYSGMLLYHFIYFTLFALVLYTTKHFATGNRNLMIASLFFGSLTIAYSFYQIYYTYIRYLLFHKKKFRRTIAKSMDTFIILASKFLPLITVILEFHNNSAPMELRALSVLFLWAFMALQLRYIKEVGIFIANLPPDNNDIPNTFINFGKSLKNVWLMLQGDYSSLSPWTDNPLLDILRNIFSFMTSLIILNILIALMNNAYERTYKHARAVWVAYIAEIIADFGFSANSNDTLDSVSYIVYEEWVEIISNPVTFGYQEGQVVQHADLPVVKDELSIALRIKLHHHASDWASSYNEKHTENFICTPGLWFTSQKSALYARFTGSWNADVGIMTTDERLLQKGYHIAYTLSDPKKRLDIYINGELAGFFCIHDVKRQNILFNDGPLYIGKSPFHAGFNGEISNFRYFNWQLSADEVSEDFGYCCVGNPI